MSDNPKVVAARHQANAAKRDVQKLLTRALVAKDGLTASEQRKLEKQIADAEAEALASRG
jgi:ATP-dependent helicase YprA (DUF1998 family)